MMPKQIPRELRSMDEAFQILQARQKAAENPAEYLPWRENKDIEQIPIPTVSRDSENEYGPAWSRENITSRIESNTRSLASLIRDPPSFIEQGEEISGQIPRDRDAEDTSNVEVYFRRMYALLARLNSDVAGNNYTTPNTHDPLEASSITPELRALMGSTCTTILKSFQMAQPNVLFPEEAGGRVSQELYPFASWIKDIKQGTRFLQWYFAEHR